MKRQGSEPYREAPECERKSRQFLPLFNCGRDGGGADGISGRNREF